MAAGRTDQASHSLHAAEVASMLLNEVPPNPRNYRATRACDVHVSESCDDFLIVVGGSPIDRSKAMAGLSTNEGRIAESESVHTISQPCTPPIYIYTTVDTSADVSQSHVITETNSKAKAAMSVTADEIGPPVDVAQQDAGMAANPCQLRAADLENIHG